MSELSPELVRHLAGLARIALTDDEVHRLAGELGVIVDAVAKVQQVAGPDVPATSHPVPLGMVTRPDVPGTTLPQELALAGAPDAADGQFRVTSILGEEQ